MTGQPSQHFILSNPIQNNFDLVKMLCVEQSVAGLTDHQFLPKLVMTICPGHSFATSSFGRPLFPSPRHCQIATTSAPSHIKHTNIETRKFIFNWDITMNAGSVRYRYNVARCPVQSSWYPIGVTCSLVSPFWMFCSKLNCNNISIELITQRIISIGLYVQKVNCKDNLP